MWWKTLLSHCLSHLEDAMINPCWISNHRPTSLRLEHKWAESTFKPSPIRLVIIIWSDHNLVCWIFSKFYAISFAQRQIPALVITSSVVYYSTFLEVFLFYKLTQQRLIWHYFALWVIFFCAYSIWLNNRDALIFRQGMSHPFIGSRRIGEIGKISAGG